MLVSLPTRPQAVEVVYYTACYRGLAGGIRLDVLVLFGFVVLRIGRLFVYFQALACSHEMNVTFF